MLEPASVEAAASGLEDSAYLGELAAIYRAYTELRDSLGRSATATRPGAGRDRRPEEGPRRLEGPPGLPLRLRRPDPRAAGAGRGALGRRARSRSPSPTRTARLLAARATLLEPSFARSGRRSEETTEPDPANTESPLLYAIERGFGNRDPEPAPPDGSLVLLRSAGERAEAEAIGAEIAGLLAAGEDPGGIAIAVRDPARRGPLFRDVLEPFGIPVALEADVPVSGTATGDRAPRPAAGRVHEPHCRRPARLPARTAQRAARRRRPARADDPPRPAAQRRSGRRGMGARSPDASSKSWVACARRRMTLPSCSRIVAEIARDIAEWPLDARGDQGGCAGPRGGRGASRRCGDRADAREARRASPGLEPGPGELIDSLRGLTMPLWRGPAEGRVRIASPYRLRAGRFSHALRRLAPGRRVPPPRRRQPLPLRRAERAARASREGRDRG